MALKSRSSRHRALPMFHGFGMTKHPALCSSAKFSRFWAVVGVAVIGGLVEMGDVVPLHLTSVVGLVRKFKRKERSFHAAPPGQTRLYSGILRSEEKTSEL